MLFSLPLGATAPKLSQTYGINLINNIFIGCLLHSSHFSKCLQTMSLFQLWEETDFILPVPSFYS